MAKQYRIRRKVRRSRPRVRRAPASSAANIRMDAKQSLSGQGGLMIGGVLDPAERAADRTADRVMRMPASQSVVRRKCEACEGDEKKVQRAPEEPEKEDIVQAKLQAKASAKSASVASGAGASAASPGAAKAIRSMGTGQPLARVERAFFEPRMGTDLSSVRVHDGPAADKANRAINARAFTLGNDIAFARGEHRPGTEAGRHLMAHELAHVAGGGGKVRQKKAPTRFTRPRKKSRLRRIGDFVRGVDKKVDDFVRGVGRAGGDWVKGVGRGAKRTGRGLKFWNNDAMIKIATENEKAMRIFRRAMSNGFDVFNHLFEIVASGLLAWAVLPEDMKKQLTKRLGDAAPKLVKKRAQKWMGKKAVKVIIHQIAKKVIVTAAYKKLASKLGTSAALSSTGIGIPVAMLNMQGVLETASQARNRLKAAYPMIYNQLSPHDLDMLWFLVEGSIENLKKKLYQEIQKQLKSPPTFCQQVEPLTSSICDNSGRICKLAKEIDDEGSRDACERSRESCKKALKRSRIACKLTTQ